MYNERLAELAEENFVSDTIDAIRTLRQKLNLNEDRLKSNIHKNAKSFESAFKYKTVQSFRSIFADIPILTQNIPAADFITENRHHIRALAENYVDQVEIVKTKGGITLEIFGYMRFRVPFWMGVDNEDFQLIINYIENAFEKERDPNRLSFEELQDKEAFLKEERDTLINDLNDVINNYSYEDLSVLGFKKQVDFLTDEIIKKEKEIAEVQNKY